MLHLVETGNIAFVPYQIPVSWGNIRSVGFAFPYANCPDTVVGFKKVRKQYVERLLADRVFTF